MGLEYQFQRGFGDYFGFRRTELTEELKKTTSSKKKKLNIPFLLSALIFALAMVGFILYLVSLNTKEGDFEWVRSKKKEVKEQEEKEEGKEGLGYYLIDGTVVQEEFKDLYLENSDIIGWIKIDDTKVDYPVVYNTEDPEFYLHKDFEKNYSFNGSIFAGAGSNIVTPGDNIILYGHHIVGKRMFGGLDLYESEDYYKEHKYITFDTLCQTGKYEVIAAFRTKVYPENSKEFKYYEYPSLLDQEAFDKYVKNIRSLTPFSTSSAEYGDQLLTLSTCAYHTSNGRFVVVAKRIEGNEVDLEKEPIEVIETEDR